jgi:hypothetical protein
MGRFIETMKAPKRLQRSHLTRSASIETTLYRQCCKTPGNEICSNTILWKDEKML